MDLLRVLIVLVLDASHVLLEPVERLVDCLDFLVAHFSSPLCRGAARRSEARTATPQKWSSVEAVEVGLDAFRARAPWLLTAVVGLVEGTVRPGVDGTTAA
jgi:hypothetical protein